MTLVGALLALASTASAMCLANVTDNIIYVKFECGTLCKNVWSTEPQKVYCHPGAGGLVSSAIVDYFGPNTLAAVTAEVEADGFAALKPGSDGRAQLCVYGQDQSKNRCESYKPVGQSGSTPAGEFAQLSILLKPTVLTRLVPASNPQP